MDLGSLVFVVFVAFDCFEIESVFNSLPSRFKREFSFDDIMRLWEALWSGVMCPNFHLVVALSLLHNEKAVIMENKFGLSEILKHLNGLAYRIDVNDLLVKAERVALNINVYATDEKAREEEEEGMEEEEVTPPARGGPPPKDPEEAVRYRRLLAIINGEKDKVMPKGRRRRIN